MSALKKNFVSAGVPSGKVRARHIGQGAYSVFRIIILLAIGFVILYPLLYMVSTSLRSRASFMNSVRVWLPEKLDALTNYRVAIKALHYKDGLISSLKYEIVSAVLEIISCAVAAYGFARFKFPFKKMFTAMLFLTILIPDTMIIIPRVVNNSQLDFLGILALFNRLTGIDLRPNVLNTGLPSSGVVILTVTVFSLIWHWNDYFLSSMYLTDGYPLAVWLTMMPKQLPTMGYSLVPSHPETMAVLMAGCLVFILPMLIIYIFVQRWFIESIDRVGITG